MKVPVKNEIADALSAFHDGLINQFSCCSENDLRSQYHPDLSQLGWHLNHIAFIEKYWLREVVLGDDSATKDFHQYYFPERIEKAEREKIEGIADFAQLQVDFSLSENLWLELSSGKYEHHLLKNNYLGWFLLQHGEQHLETMQMVLQQRALAAEAWHKMSEMSFEGQEPAQPDCQIPAGEYEIGSTSVLACDNELAVHTQKIPAYYISTRAVSNAEYLGFIQAGGYQRKEFWSYDGWLWNLSSGCICPDHWRLDDQGKWYCLSFHGKGGMGANEAVSGLSWFEADAFARYAGFRLPHEFEWEAAMKNSSMLLTTTGQAWEWCGNTFFPYKGFKAFPYQRYSTPWFDDRHYLLRGSSPYTGDTVRQTSFRNFYEPDKRHIFAGLRLARDAG